MVFQKKNMNGISECCLGALECIPIRKVLDYSFPDRQLAILIRQLKDFIVEIGKGKKANSKIDF